MRACESGQSTAEYVGLLALTAAVLLGGGAAVGLGDVGTAVAATVRTGICIVAGDICRDSDAVAAGLEPCTVGERSDGAGATVSIGWLRLGKSGLWTVASRSDGSVLVTQVSERRGGAGAGIGLEASPLGLEFGVAGAIDLTISSGATYEFPSAAAAGRFLAGDREGVEPVWRFGEAGEMISGELAARLGGATLGGVFTSARAAAGARLGRGMTTLYIRTRLGSGATLWLPGRAGRVVGPSTGDVIVELTLDGTEPRELAFRNIGRGRGAGEVVDTVARLDLRHPANRRAAGTVLAHSLPWPPELAPRLRALALLAVQRGVIERSVYSLRDDSSSFELAARFGAELGVMANEVHVQRRLVAASAWTDGGRERVREDCLR